MAKISKSGEVNTFQGRLLDALLSFFGALPLRVNRAFGRAIGFLFRVIPNRSRRIAATNIDLCFPGLAAVERRALLREHLVETGKAWAELGYFWRRRRTQIMRLICDVEGDDILRDALAQGNGVLLAAPHLGAWELLCQYLAVTAPTAVLYREPRDPGIEAVINEGRSRFGATPVRAGGQGVRELLRALAQGAIVGILPDQQPKRGQGEFAPFFGIEALTMVLFSRLAARTQAPVVLGSALRKPGAEGFTLVFRRGNEKIGEADLSQSVSALNRDVEAMVALAPAQYQWGYKRFSIRPPGQPKLYP